MTKPLVSDDAQKAFRDIAKAMALHCVRNTHLETLHSRFKDFNDAEMKTLMVQVCDNLYTFLCLMNAEDPQVRRQFAGMLDHFCPPPNWQEPQISTALVESVENWKEHETMFYPQRKKSGDKPD
jgi:hypothetical protein